MVESTAMRRDSGDDGPTLKDLAALVRRRREALPTESGQGVPVKTIATTAGVSPVTWHRVETGEKAVQRLSYSAIESALGWPAGSITAYLDGGPEPAPAPGEADEPPGARGASLLDVSTDELVDQLRRGQEELIAEWRRRNDQLLAELRRRLHHMEPATPVTAQRRHLAASSEDTETVESVEARGMRAGLPIGSGEGGDESVAEGGQG